MATVRHGYQGQLLLDNSKSGLPCPIYDFQPLVMVAKENFCLAIVRHGCQAQFMLDNRKSGLPGSIYMIGNRQSWLPRQISDWQLSVMVAKPKLCLLGNRQTLLFSQISAWQLSVMVAKANYCLTTVSHGFQGIFLLCNRQSCLLRSIYP